MVGVVQSLPKFNQVVFYPHVISSIRPSYRLIFGVKGRQHERKGSGFISSTMEHIILRDFFRMVLRQFTVLDHKLVATIIAHCLGLALWIQGPEFDKVTG